MRGELPGLGRHFPSSHPRNCLAAISARASRVAKPACTRARVGGFRAVFEGEEIFRELLKAEQGGEAFQRMGGAFQFFPVFCRVVLLQLGEAAGKFARKSPTMSSTGARSSSLQSCSSRAGLNSIPSAASVAGGGTAASSAL